MPLLSPLPVAVPLTGNPCVAEAATHCHNLRRAVKDDKGSRRRYYDIPPWCASPLHPSWRALLTSVHASQVADSNHFSVQAQVVEKLVLIDAQGFIDGVSPLPRPLAWLGVNVLKQVRHWAGQARPGRARSHCKACTRGHWSWGWPRVGSHPALFLHFAAMNWKVANCHWMRRTPHHTLYQSFTIIELLLPLSCCYH